MIYNQSVKKMYSLEEKEILTNLGLADKEALIYLAAISSGGGTISDLADQCHIERTGIYYHIDKLLNLKLIKPVARGKRTYYLPNDPERLRDIIDQRQKKFSSILPSLQERFSKKANKSIFEFYEGEEEVDHFYSRVYSILEALEPPENTIYVFGNSFKTIIDTNRAFLKFKSPENRINIKTRTILPMCQKSKHPEGLEDHPYIITRYNLPPAEIKYISDKYDYPGSIVIAGDKIALHDWRNLSFSITENKNNASTWRMFFEFTWDHLK